MATRRGAGCGFHLPQQRVHFRRGQPPPGANAAMAGKPGNRRIQLAVKRGAFRILGQFFRHIAEQRRRIGGAE